MHHTRLTRTAALAGRLTLRARGFVSPLASLRVLRADMQLNSQLPIRNCNPLAAHHAKSH